MVTYEDLVKRRPQTPLLPQMVPYTFLAAQDRGLPGERDGNEARA